MREGESKLTKLPNGEVVQVKNTWDCTMCQESGLYEKRNCLGNLKLKKPILNIGKEEYYRCPLAEITNYNVFDIINLIDWSDNTGIPIYGTCLLDQSNYLYLRRSIIYTERAKVREEIKERQPKKNYKEENNAVSNTPRVIPKPIPRGTKQPISKESVSNTLKRISKRN